MYILPSIIGENNILKLSLIWILRKKFFFLKIQISTVQYCLKLQNIMYCIVNQI